MPQHDLSLGRHFADQPAADHPRYRVSSDLGRVQTRRSWVGPTGNDLSSRVRMGSEPFHLRASVRRHRRAQEGSPMLRSITRMALA